MNVLFVSLGCDKNLVDSEEMLGDLTQAGYEITDDEEEAEAAVVNTCCFINDAKKESIESILELAERRTAGQLRALIVTGCLAQRYSEDILREIPEVDAVIGTTAQDTLVQTLQEVTGRREISGKEEKDQALVRLNDLRRIPRTDAKRVLTTANGYAYLRIAEGCSKCCTYCVIPSIRGGYRSLPMESVIRTAGELAAQGVRELILVAQETTVYGTDLYGKKMLPELLDRLAEIDGIRWIRLLYCYPEEITPELVETIRRNPKILHYIDMPIQHASDDVLRRMGRRTNKKELEDIIGLLRKEIPDICLRTTLISGFPGETDQDHQEALDFVRRIGFAECHVFRYSQMEGTAAAKRADQVDGNVKKVRSDQMLAAAAEGTEAFMKRMQGKVFDVILEQKESGYWTGYTQNYVKIGVQMPDDSDHHGEEIRVRADGYLDISNANHEASGLEKIMKGERQL